MAPEHMIRNGAKRTDRYKLPRLGFNYRVKCACAVLWLLVSDATVGTCVPKPRPHRREP